MKKIVFIVIMLIWTGIVFAYGMKIGINGTEKRLAAPKEITEPNYSGQEIQDAVNTYRAQLNLNELKTDSNLCNNIYDRYSKMLSDEAISIGHPGFDEWADQKIADFGYTLLGEVFSPDPTVAKVMDGWKNSPGHNSAITNKAYTKICTYAGNKGVVVIMGVK